LITLGVLLFHLAQATLVSSSTIHSKGLLMKRRRVVIAGVTASAGFFAVNSINSLSGADAQSTVQTMHSTQQASRANLNRQLRQASSNPMQGFALANIAISTPNQEKMIAWYRDVLGFRLVEKTEVRVESS